MKFCDNCGTQLADNVLFCEECGAKVEQIAGSVILAQENLQTELNCGEQPPKLSEICTPAKRQLKDWVFIALLVLCSPIISVNLILWLPEFLFWIVFVGTQIAVLANMWFKRKWKGWIKIAITAAYILMYII